MTPREEEEFGTEREEEFGVAREREFGTVREKETQPLTEKSASQLEDEIAQIRADMNSTLDAIERRLTPGEMVDRFMHSMRGGPGEYASNFGRAVRDNPIPTALVGIGLLWMILGGGNGSYQASTGKTSEWRETGRRTAEKGKQRWREISGSLSEKMHRVGEARQSISGSLTEKMHRMGEVREGASERTRMAGSRLGETATEVRHRAERAKSGFSYLLHEQPLILAAIGIGVGAILSAAVPVSRKEQEVLGEAAEEVRGRVREKAEEQAAKVEQVAAASVEAAREETERQLH